MQLRDPTGDTEPDFLSDNWEGLRNVMMEEGRTVDEAIEILKRGWKVQHEKNVAAWNEQLEQRRQNLEEERNEEERRPSPPANAGNEDDEVPEWLDCHRAIFRRLFYTRFSFTSSCSVNRFHCSLRYLCDFDVSTLVINL